MSRWPLSRRRPMPPGFAEIVERAHADARSQWESDMVSATPPDHFCTGSHATRAPDPVPLPGWAVWTVFGLSVVGALAVVGGAVWAVVKVVGRAR